MELNQAPAARVSSNEQRLKRQVSAMEYKDSQIKTLNNKNTELISMLSTVEENHDKLVLEKQNFNETVESLKKHNTELQLQLQSLRSKEKQESRESSERDKRIEVLAHQNMELVRLLDQEEIKNNELSRANDEQRKQRREIEKENSELKESLKQLEDTLSSMRREMSAQTTEVRVLKMEKSSIESKLAEEKKKYEVEVESAVEQLRLRKEKQYDLLEKIQRSEDLVRSLEDENFDLGGKLKAVSVKYIELKTQMDKQRGVLEEVENAQGSSEEREVQLRRINSKLESDVLEKEKAVLKLESESRESSLRLREMAEKVFQLLERLKMSELGKSKTLELLKKSESDVLSLKKKNERLMGSLTEEGRKLVAHEMCKKALEEQILVLKTQSNQASNKARKEANDRMKMEDKLEKVEKKNNVLSGRVSFLLNKLQSAEEISLAAEEEVKRKELALQTGMNVEAELKRKIRELLSKSAILVETLRLKKQEYEELRVRYQKLEQTVNGSTLMAEKRLESSVQMEKIPDKKEDMPGKHNNTHFKAVDNFKNIKTLRMIVPCGSKTKEGSKLIEQHDLRRFLIMSQKDVNAVHLLIERMAKIMSEYLDTLLSLNKTKKGFDKTLEQLKHAERIGSEAENKLVIEEEAKRKIMLKYMNSVKDRVLALDRKQSSSKYENSSDVIQYSRHVDVGLANSAFGNGLHEINLSSAEVGEEECLALAAFFKGLKLSYFKQGGSEGKEPPVFSLNLRGNLIDDRMCESLLGILKDNGFVSRLDLRENYISSKGMDMIVEALKLNEGVRHVYTHPDGRIEALGTVKREDKLVVETTHVVDCRNNKQGNSASRINLLRSKKKKIKRKVEAKKHDHTGSNSIWELNQETTKNSRNNKGGNVSKALAKKINSAAGDLKKGGGLSQVLNIRLK